MLSTKVHFFLFPFLMHRPPVSRCFGLEDQHLPNGEVAQVASHVDNSLSLLINQSTPT